MVCGLCNKRLSELLVTKSNEFSQGWCYKKQKKITPGS
nr:MAG TPA: hypothetical protein [Caudoviricetes sp.]